MQGKGRDFMNRIFIILTIVLFAVGCAPTKITTVPEDGEKEKAATPETVAASEEKEASKKVTAEDIARAFQEDTGLAVRDIHFDYDRYEIREDSSAILMKLSDWLIKNRAGATIEGHCDERGTKEYNLALGDRRATAVKDFLISTGLSPDRLSTISLGEERPQCTEHNESCWWKNRRAHFTLSK
jgi:peptidoglycan-associated lipoprotein